MFRIRQNGQHTGSRIQLHGSATLINPYPVHLYNVSSCTAIFSFIYIEQK